MNNNEEIEEIEVFLSSDEFMILQISAILEDNKIPYIKINESRNENRHYTSGITKIIVSNEHYEKATTLIREIIDAKNLKEEELPEELRDVDDEYFEELVKKGTISSYTNKEGKTLKFISKKEFKKKLIKEKDEIIKDKKIIKLIYLFIIPLLILEIVRIYYRNINDFEIQLFRWIIEIVAIIPILLINININRKIKRMYKKHINGEEYKNTEKRISKKIIVCSVIISIMLLGYSLDWVNTVVTGNKPIFSKLEKSQEKNEQYSSLLYNYISVNNGRKLIKPKKEIITNPYLYSFEDGSELKLNRTELIKNKVYIGIPNFLKDMNKESKDSINGMKILAFQGIKFDLISYIFSSNQYNETIDNKEIDEKIRDNIQFQKKMYKDSISILKNYITKIDGKNIGIVEYVVNKENNYKENHFNFIFECEGKLIESDVLIFTNQENVNNGLGELMIRTLEIYD